MGTTISVSSDDEFPTVPNEQEELPPQMRRPPWTGPNPRRLLYKPYRDESRRVPDSTRTARTSDHSSHRAGRRSGGRAAPAAANGITDENGMVGSTLSGAGAGAGIGYMPSGLSPGMPSGASPASAATNVVLGRASPFPVPQEVDVSD